MLFERIYHWFSPPEEPEKRRLYVITRKEDRFFIYTRDNHLEVNSLKHLGNGWEFVRAGILGVDTQEVFEVENMLNGFRDNSREFREKASESLDKRYGDASQESKSRCVASMAKVYGHKTIDEALAEGIERLNGKDNAH